MKKEKLLNILNMVVLILVVLSSVTSIVGMIYLLTDIVDFKETKIELGNTSYEKELFGYENIEVRDGYWYRITENNIDVNTVGKYEVVVEISGQGEERTEKKKIEVVDTTPAKVSMKRTVYYVGEKIDLSKELVITDLSGKDGVINYSEANVKCEKGFDTSKVGTSKITVETTDLNGVTGKTELTIQVKEPIVVLQSYIEEKILEYNKNNKNGTYSLATSSGDFVLKYTPKNSYSVDYTLMNFTQGIYTEEEYNTNKTYFDSNFKATKYVEGGYYSDYTYTSGSYFNSAQTALTNEIKTINTMLDDVNGKLNLYGKTAEEVKTLTVDLRTLHK